MWWIREDNPKSGCPGAAGSKVNIKLTLSGISATKEVLAPEGLWEPVENLQKSWDWAESSKRFLASPFLAINGVLEQKPLLMTSLVVFELPFLCLSPWCFLGSWTERAALISHSVSERSVYAGRAVLGAEATGFLPRRCLCPGRSGAVGLWGEPSPGPSGWSGDGYRAQSWAREQGRLRAVKQTEASPICSLLLSSPHTCCLAWCFPRVSE